MTSNSNEYKRIAIGLEYCGSAYQGWQTQAHESTIQACLEWALAQIAGHPVRAHAAGRTDAGVHACMQVVHFDTWVSRPVTAWVRGSNRYLPKDIAILWAAEVTPSFHTRFSAQARHYAYVLSSSAIRPGLNHGRIGWTHHHLALQPMQEALQYCLGTHDFSAFRASSCQASSPIRNMIEVDIHQAQEQYFVFRFSANGFLHHMVRNLLGTLIYVGKGSWTPQDFLSLLQSRQRSNAPPTFMPDGLYFHGVSYPFHERVLPYPTRGTMPNLGLIPPG